MDKLSDAENKQGKVKKQKLKYFVLKFGKFIKPKTFEGNESQHC